MDTESINQIVGSTKPFDGSLKNLTLISGGRNQAWQEAKGYGQVLLFPVQPKKSPLELKRPEVAVNTFELSYA